LTASHSNVVFTSDIKSNVTSNDYSLHYKIVEQNETENKIVYDSSNTQEGNFNGVTAKTANDVCVLNFKINNENYKNIFDESYKIIPYIVFNNDSSKTIDGDGLEFSINNDYISNVYIRQTSSSNTLANGDYISFVSIVIGNGQYETT